MDKEKIMQIVEHCLAELDAVELDEFQNQLLDWEASILMKKNGNTVRCMLTRGNRTEVVMLPEEVADFILLYNGKR